eukprot:TRINITY_DN9750_c0_g2_i2.p1 TRINITY_DN9750_c0_g2~~TRINITY_DN9750_c0_g2_i2.p1  ORF type:complete len:276 (-),score=33.69 TRINITY_DN9750_c0_g2_i2:22-849(-)
MYTCQTYTNPLIMTSKMCTNLTGVRFGKLFAKAKYLNSLKVSYWKSDQISPYSLKSLSKFQSPHDLLPLSLLLLLFLPHPLLLQQLHHCHSTLTDAHRNMSVQTLKFGKWEVISDTEIYELVTCSPNLTCLTLDGCYRITDQSLGLIGQALGPNLKKLCVRSCPVLTSAGLESLCTASTNLTQLFLDGCTEIKSNGVKAVANYCRQLEVLGLAQLGKITDSDIQYLVYRCANLKRLNLQGCSLLTSKFLFEKMRHQCARLTLEVDENMKVNVYTF